MERASWECSVEPRSLPLSLPLARAHSLCLSLSRARSVSLSFLLPPLTYAYMCVCVCVCVCTIYTYIHSMHTHLFVYVRVRDCLSPNNTYACVCDKHARTASGLLRRLAIPGARQGGGGQSGGLAGALRVRGARSCRHFSHRRSTLVSPRERRRRRKKTINIDH